MTAFNTDLAHVSPRPSALVSILRRAFAGLRRRFAFMQDAPRPTCRVPSAFSSADVTSWLYNLSTDANQRR